MRRSQPVQAQDPARNSLKSSQNEEPKTKLQTCRLPEAFVRIGLVLDGVGPKKLKTRENQQPVTAVGIWGPEGSAGIGFVTDEVGPKKLKTGTYQQPSSSVEQSWPGE